MKTGIIPSPKISIYFPIDIANPPAISNNYYANVIRAVYIEYVTNTGETLTVSEFINTVILPDIDLTEYFELINA